MSNLNLRNYFPKRLIFLIITELFSLMNAASIPIANSTTAKTACNTRNNNENFYVVCASLNSDFAFNEEFSHLSTQKNDSSSYVDQNATVNSLVLLNSTLNSFHTAFSHHSFQSLQQLSLENVTFYKKLGWTDFSQLKNLQFIYIYNTSLPITINSSLGQNFCPTLESLTITESNITDIKADSFEELKNLRYLRISHNKLTSFPKLKSAEKLEEIRLDSNCIHLLEAGVFDDFPKLKVLSLSSNRISTLPENVFSSIWNSTVHIELRDNPVKCDCRLLWIVNSPSKPSNIIGQCASPKRLFGKHLIDLTLEDLSC